MALADLHHRGVPAAQEALPRLRDSLMWWARQSGLSKDNVQALVLATYEAMVNVAQHAYPTGQGAFDLLAVLDDRAKRVTVTVTDTGRWQNAPASDETHRGRGVRLIYALAEAQIDAGRHGTRVQMSWLAPGQRS